MDPFGDGEPDLALSVLPNGMGTLKSRYPTPQHGNGVDTTNVNANNSNLFLSLQVQRDVCSHREKPGLIRLLSLDGLSRAAGLDYGCAVRLWILQAERNESQDPS